MLRNILLKCKFFIHKIHYKIKNAQNRVVMFSRNLKLIRKVWGLNQDDFGKLFNVTRGAINQYEVSRSEPRIWVIIELQILTGINAQDIYYSELNKDMIPKHPLSDYETKAPITMKFEDIQGEYGPVSRMEFKRLEAEVKALKEKINQK